MDRNIIITKCKKELALGKVEYVINFLIKNTSENSELNMEMILISSRFQRLKAKQLAGTIKYEDSEIQLTKITRSVLEVLVTL